MKYHRSPTYHRSHTYNHSPTYYGGITGKMMTLSKELRINIINFVKNELKTGIRADIL